MFEVKNENVHDKKCIRYIKKKVISTYDNKKFNGIKSFKQL